MENKRKVSLEGKFQESGKSKNARGSVCPRNHSWARVGIREVGYMWCHESLMPLPSTEKKTEEDSVREKCNQPRCKEMKLQRKIRE